MNTGMCRLFGFRSVIESQVHSSLMEAENALGTQSNAHPDGWGVAYYVDGCPQLTRSPAHALGDQLFHRLSGVVSSQTVLAHVRKATQGEKTVLNCHPFQHGRWVFAHNGDIPDFADIRAQLVERVAPGLRRFILGDTDSEVIFFLFLSELEKLVPLSHAGQTREVVQAVKRATQIVRETSRARSVSRSAGCTGDDPTKVEAVGSEVVDGAESHGERPLLLTLIVTDGNVLVGVQGGKDLYLSTHKHRCSERDSCPSLSPECEAESRTGFVNHFIVSSEPLSGQNVWTKLEPGTVAAVDGSMRTLRTHLDHVSLPLA